LVSTASGGWPLVLTRAITNLPSRPRSLAAAAAASIAAVRHAGQFFARVDDDAEALVSFSTFCAKALQLGASSALWLSAWPCRRPTAWRRRARSPCGSVPAGAGFGIEAQLVALVVQRIDAANNFDSG
jgi:hypothetical protein